VVPLCTFVHPNGKTCASPALRHQSHCYFHNPRRRISGPCHPTSRLGYRWYSIYRKIPSLRREQVMPLHTQLLEAVINNEIRQETLFKILNRLNDRVVELGQHMIHEPAAPALPNRNQSRNSQSL
jgi:hypothetical protein